ncbi:hypothetical protein V491_06966 [Pseudogymnoascus sp. VKM F-3775]|nr:hypothetical protein V491_06966 [Pseudogymnoascus sp. VKM F-3775]
MGKCLVHVPQLSLQHTSSDAQVFGPQTGPVAAATAALEPRMQTSPGLVQISMSGLQHTSSDAQVFDPQTGPVAASTTGSVTGQPWIQNSPGLAQMLQRALQHTKPAPQTAVPHCPPPTHWATLSMTWQAVPEAHFTTSQELARPLRTGLAMAPVAAVRSTKALTERGLKEII